MHFNLSCYFSSYILILSYYRAKENLTNLCVITCNHQLIMHNNWLYPFLLLRTFFFTIFRSFHLFCSFGDSTQNLQIENEGCLLAEQLYLVKNDVYLN